MENELMQRFDDTMSSHLLDSETEYKLHIKFFVISLFTYWGFSYVEICCMFFNCTTSGVFYQIIFFTPIVIRWYETMKMIENMSKWIYKKIVALSFFFENLIHILLDLIWHKI